MVCTAANRETEACLSRGFFPFQPRAGFRVRNRAANPVMRIGRTTEKRTKADAAPTSPTYIMQTQLLHEIPTAPAASNPIDRVLVNEPLTDVGTQERRKLYRGSRGAGSPGKGMPGKGMQRYVLFHSFCFIMYATVGKGFAYTGYPPIFIGEILLLWSIITAFAARRFATLIERPLGLLLTAFFIWGIVCTVPYVGLYKINALRDGAVWAYSIFAWVVASLVLRLDNVLEGVVERFRKYGGVMIVAGTVCGFLTTYEFSHLPTWPTSQVPIPYLKSGELCVHLAGCCAFVLTGLGKGKDWWLFPIICGFAMGISGNRGGGLAFIVAVTFVALLRFNVKKIFILFAVLAFLLSALLLIDIHIPLPKGSREISSEQILRNIQSVVGGGSDDSNLEGTKEWRLRWWNQIFDYTFHGPYFWTGKGYGINLAADDGIDGIRDGPQALRSPHNSHLTFLARSGVPGLTLWIILQSYWALMMLRFYFRAKAIGSTRWSAMFLWLLAYWMAFIVNASFDVALEGPMMGIPFWTIFGLGWGAQILFQKRLRRRVTSGRTQQLLPTGAEPQLAW